MADFWAMFMEDVELGVADGPQWFSDVNCPQVRDELAAPATVAIHNASSRVVLGPDDSPLVPPDGRAEAIGRLGEGLVLPEGGSFELLVDASHTETELALTAVLAQNAWCQWVGVLIDTIDAGDWLGSFDAAAGLNALKDSETLRTFDDERQREYRRNLVESGTAGDPFLAVADYRANCFAIDPARDERLGSQ